MFKRQTCRQGRAEGPTPPNDLGVPGAQGGPALSPKKEKKWKKRKKKEKKEYEKEMN